MRRKKFSKCVYKNMQLGFSKKEAKKICKEELNKNKELEARNDTR